MLRQAGKFGSRQGSGIRRECKAGRRLCSSEGNAMQAKSWATNVKWTTLHFTTGVLED